MYQIRSVHCPAGEETLTVTSEKDSDSYVEGISAQLPNSPPPIGDAPQSANRQQTPCLLPSPQSSSSLLNISSMKKSES